MNHCFRVKNKTPDGPAILVQTIDKTFGTSSRHFHPPPIPTKKQKTAIHFPMGMNAL
jgi:hypothetical protein